MIMRFLAVLVPLCTVASSTGGGGGGGRIMFWAPMISTSMRITFQPLAEELARRGHSVTVVMPFHREGKAVPGLEVVTIDSTFQELSDAFSRYVRFTYLQFKHRFLINLIL